MALTWCCLPLDSQDVHVHVLSFMDPELSCGPVPGCFSSWVLVSRPWLFFFSWVLGFVPGCFSSRVLGSRPWLFFFLHVHLARVSPNLLLTLWVFHRRFGAFEAFFVSISQNLFHTCLLWHRPFSSLPHVGPLFCCLFTCLLLALLM